MRLLRVARVFGRFLQTIGLALTFDADRFGLAIDLFLGVLGRVRGTLRIFLGGFGRVLETVGLIL